MINPARRAMLRYFFLFVRQIDVLAISAVVAREETFQYGMTIGRANFLKFRHRINGYFVIIEPR